MAYNNTSKTHLMQQRRSHLVIRNKPWLHNQNNANLLPQGLIANIGVTGIDSLTCWLKIEDTPFISGEVPAWFTKGSRFRGSLKNGTNSISEIRYSKFGFRCKFNIAKLRRDGEPLALVFDRLQVLLQEKLRLNLDLKLAVLKKIEIFRDIRHEYPYRYYFELLQSLHFSRKKPSIINNSTLYWKSKHFQIKIYDKSQQLRGVKAPRSVSQKIPDNILRIEYTFMRKAAELTKLGVISVADLLQEWHQLESRSFASLNASLQRIEFIEWSVPGYSADRIQEAIRLFHRQTRMPLEAAFVFVYAFSARIIQRSHFEKFLLTCLDINANTLRSSKRRFNDQISKVSAILFSEGNIGIGVLMQELIAKLIPAYVRGHDLSNPFDTDIELERLKKVPTITDWRT